MTSTEAIRRLVSVIDEFTQADRDKDITAVALAIVALGENENDGWFSISDMIPGYGCNVIVYTNSNDIKLAYMDSDDDFYDSETREKLDAYWWRRIPALPPDAPF